MIIFDELGHKSRNGIGVDGILMKILRNQETAASVGGGLPEHVKIARLFFFLPAACLSALRFFFFFFPRAAWLNCRGGNAGGNVPGGEVHRREGFGCESEETAGTRLAATGED